jgi:aminoglycoside phosphotransferase (APT) family kinase protein
VRRLHGGTWLSTHALSVAMVGGSRREVVLRRWARPGWEADDPLATPASEARTLELVGRADPTLPVPRVLAFDPVGDEADVPALLLSLLPGRAPRPATVRRPATLRTLAESLVAIQGLDGGLRAVVQDYYPYYRVADLAAPAASTHRDLWERAIEIAAEEPPPGRTAFIHRDFHPGNTLWHGPHLTGIVDWTAACWGPPGADLAHLLANLGVDHGPEVADVAADFYCDAGGNAPDEAWWRIRGFLDFFGDHLGEPPKNLEAAERYLEALLRQF